jgi:hypothetical protein
MSQPPTVTRHEVLDILENHWPQYHSRLREMTDDDLLDWADAQGYDRPQDVLAHINAWFEEMLRILPVVLRGEKYQRDWATIDEFNARAVKHARDQSLDYALSEGDRLRSALFEAISALNDETVANNYLNRWLYGTIVEHIHEHALP